MINITYQGEHLWIYYVGHLLILMAFFSAVYAVFSFWKLQKDYTQKIWQQALRSAYYLHGISIIAIITLLISIMYFHFFEYNYVWAHVSDELPTRYILAAFWEGQEGSFLLWMFWNVVLAWWFAKSNEKKQPICIIASHDGYSFIPKR
jgi:cytochrome c-type biogenesis protein CcmF